MPGLDKIFNPEPPYFPVDDERIIPEIINKFSLDNQALLSQLANGELSHVPYQYSLDQNDADHGWLMRILNRHPENSQLHLEAGIKYLAQMIYNQVMLSPLSLTEMQQNATDFYYRIAPIIFGNPRIQESNYTDNKLAADHLAHKIINFGISPDLATVGLPTIGQGLTELAALRQIGVPIEHIYGNDLLPYNLLYPHLADPDLPRLSSQGKLRQDNLINFCYGNRGAFDLIISAGSSLVNNEGVIAPLEQFLAIASALKPGGLFIYETRDYDTPNDNPIREEVLAYMKQKPARPPGSKAMHPDYRQDNLNSIIFGALLHSEAFIHSLSTMCGLTEQQSYCEKSWAPRPDLHRTFHILKKTSDPQPIATELIKLTYSAFARRFPKDAALPLPISLQIEMPMQGQDAQLILH